MGCKPSKRERIDVITGKILERRIAIRKLKREKEEAKDGIAYYVFYAFMAFIAFILHPSSPPCTRWASPSAGGRSKTWRRRRWTCGRRSWRMRTRRRRKKRNEALIRMGKIQKLEHFFRKNQSCNK